MCARVCVAPTRSRRHPPSLLASQAPPLSPHALTREISEFSKSVCLGNGEIVSVKSGLLCDGPSIPLLLASP